MSLTLHRKKVTFSFTLMIQFLGQWHCIILYSLHSSSIFPGAPRSLPLRYGLDFPGAPRSLTMSYGFDKMTWCHWPWPRAPGKIDEEKVTFFMWRVYLCFSIYLSFDIIWKYSNWVRTAFIIANDNKIVHISLQKQLRENSSCHRLSKRSHC